MLTPKIKNATLYNKNKGWKSLNRYFVHNLLTKPLMSRNKIGKLTLSTFNLDFSPTP